MPTNPAPDKVGPISAWSEINKAVDRMVKLLKRLVVSQDDGGYLFKHAYYQSSPFLMHKSYSLLPNAYDNVWMYMSNRHLPFGPKERMVVLPDLAMHDTSVIGDMRLLRSLSDWVLYLGCYRYWDRPDWWFHPECFPIEDRLRLAEYVCLNCWGMTLHQSEKHATLDQTERKNKFRIEIKDHLFTMGMLLLHTEWNPVKQIPKWQNQIEGYTNMADAIKMERFYRWQDQFQTRRAQLESVDWRPRTWTTNLWKEWETSASVEKEREEHLAEVRTARAELAPKAKTPPPVNPRKLRRVGSPQPSGRSAGTQKRATLSPHQSARASSQEPHAVRQRVQSPERGAAAAGPTKRRWDKPRAAGASAGASSSMLPAPEVCDSISCPAVCKHCEHNFKRAVRCARKDPHSLHDEHWCLCGIHWDSSGRTWMYRDP